MHDLASTAAAHYPYVAGPALVAEAEALIADFGPTAMLEAAARASRSRDIGNAIHFCRWRQVERLIVLMISDRALGTLH